MLAEYLDRYRMTFELKCEGLTVDQLATRSVPPSTMSLLGLIRHLARVEHSWTRRVFEGQAQLSRLYRTEEDPDQDFNDAAPDEDVLADAWDTWRGEVAHSRAVYIDLDLDATVEVHGKAVEGRDIVVHLIEEYAPHLGHADLLRECIDGRTGSSGSRRYAGTAASLPLLGRMRWPSGMVATARAWRLRVARRL